MAKDVFLAPNACMIRRAINSAAPEVSSMPQHRTKGQQQEDFAQNIRDTLVDRIDDLRGRQPGRKSQAKANDQQGDEGMNVVANNEHQKRDQRRCRA